MCTRKSHDTFKNICIVASLTQIFHLFFNTFKVLLITLLHIFQVYINIYLYDFEVFHFSVSFYSSAKYY